MPRQAIDEEALMEVAVELGVDDLAIEDDHYALYTAVEDFATVQEGLERKGLELDVKQLAMIPQNTIEVGPDKGPQVLRLMEALEDHDDVQNVWANFDIDDELLTAHAG